MLVIFIYLFCCFVPSSVYSAHTGCTSFLTPFNAIYLLKKDSFFQSLSLVETEFSELKFFFVSGENVDKVVQENKENKSSGKKKRKREKGNQVRAGEAVKFSIEGKLCLTC